MSNLKSVLKEFKKTYKADVAMLGVHDDDPPRLRSNIFAFDLATGGGIPLGRCSIIYGPEASMKTTLCLKLIAQAQKQFPKKKCVFIDVEGHFSVPWATHMGVNCEDLVYVLPPSAEDFVDMAEGLMYATDVSLLVVDSLAALVTTNELESSASKAQPAGSGLIINKFYRKMSHVLTLARLEEDYPTLLCINQIRQKIGVVYGNPEVMPGGHAFKFASTMTIRVYGKDKIVKEVNEQLPAYKEVRFVIKKYKVPVVAPVGEFLIALQPIADPPLQVGDSYDWNTVRSYLKSYGLLVSEDGKWHLQLDEIYEFGKQDDVKQMMADDPEFNAKVKAKIIKEVVDGKPISEKG